MGFKKLATRLRMATMNVGSMTIENYIFCGITGKGRGLADVLNGRRIDMACVQETRWKG